jgi:hypothetical protein
LPAHVAESVVAEPNALLIIAHTPVTDIVGYLLAFTHQTFLANGPSPGSKR